MAQEPQSDLGNGYLMNPGMGAWAVRASMEPAANLAAMLVERLEIRPPFDIDKLVSEYADVFEENWPYHGCDAVVVRLFASRPTIYLRSGLRPRRRLFTLAHELGHIQMWWHVGDLGCEPNSEQST